MKKQHKAEHRSALLCVEKERGVIGGFLFLIGLVESSQCFLLSQSLGGAEFLLGVSVGIGQNLLNSPVYIGAEVGLAVELQTANLTNSGQDGCHSSGSSAKSVMTMSVRGMVTGAMAPLLARFS